MKIKYLYLISSLLFVSNILTAQADKPLPKYEFQFGYGIFPTTKVQAKVNREAVYFFDVDCIFGRQAFPHKKFTNPNTSDLLGISSAYHANFSIQLSTRWRLRLATSFQQKKKEVGYIYKTSFLTSLVHSDFYWMQRKHLSLYSGAGFGVEVLTHKAITNDKTYKDTYSAFAFHLNGLGIRVGGKIGGFLELGYGAQGIVATGVCARF